MTEGELGEKLACIYLQRRGYEILERNYHSRWGEIDIIARRDGFLVFAEVKTRSPGALVPPEEAVTPAKQRKLMKTAQQYLLRFPRDLQPRFDVLALTLEPGGARVRHYENAFEARGDYVPF